MTMDLYSTVWGRRGANGLVVGALLAVAVTGCAGPASHPGHNSTASAPTGQATDHESDLRSNPTMEPAPGLEPLGQNPTRDELIILMERTTAAFTGSVAGPWQQLDGTAYPGPQLNPETFLENPARTCASVYDEPEDKASKGYDFGYRLEGPGVADPAATLDQARVWAQANGWREAESGPGSGSDESGSVFIHFTGIGLPSLTFGASTEITRYSIQTPCSTHPTVLKHYTDRAEDPKYEYKLHNDPYADPTDSAIPRNTTG